MQCTIRFGLSPTQHFTVWEDHFALQGRTNPMGRPSTLTAEENAVVVKYFDSTRAAGAKLDEEGILVMVQQVVRACRGSNALACTLMNCGPVISSVGRDGHGVLGILTAALPLLRTPSLTTSGADSCTMFFCTWRSMESRCHQGIALYLHSCG